jgi:conjugative transfer pilus assembly protein TraH
MAQGIVNDATSARDLKGKTDASIAATVTGITSDVFSSREEVDTGGKTPEESLGNAELEKRELIGNIVWQQLKKQNVSSWFASGDEQLLEVMMSLTGTVIRQPPSPDPNASGSPSSASTTQLLDTKPAMPGVLNALLNGGSVDIYKCDTPDKCLNPTIQNVTLSGLGQKVSDMLLGTASSPGIIEKYSTNTSILNTSEKSFVSQLPSGAGTIIRNLSILSRDASSMFALKSSNAIALNMVYLTSEELLRATTQATNQSKSPHKHAAIQLITESQSKIRLDYMELRSQHGDVNDLIAHYSDMLLMIRKQRYTLANLSTPRRTKE